MTKVYNLLNKKDEVIGINVETKKESFTIPVVDVRRSDDQRRKANQILKAANIHKGSKFFSPSYSWLGYSYNVSRK